MGFFDDDDKFADAWHEAVLDSFFDEESRGRPEMRPAERKLAKKELKRQRREKKRRRGFFGL